MEFFQTKNNQKIIENTDNDKKYKNFIKERKRNNKKEIIKASKKNTGNIKKKENIFKNINFLLIIYKISKMGNKIENICDCINANNINTTKEERVNI
jgi:hypothetical protein